MRGRSDPMPDQAPSRTEPSLAADSHASIATTMKREVAGPPAATTPGPAIPRSESHAHEDVASSDTIRHEDPKAFAGPSAAPGPDAPSPSPATPASHPRTVDPTGALQDLGAFGDRYGFRNVLGEGGMGEVRLYRDERIGRDVAVKVLRRRNSPTAGSERVSSDAEPRFLREARVQGQLEHPAIVPVYDLGKGPDGQPFFTMKRVRGKTLEDIVTAVRAGDADATTRYSRRKLLTAFSQVCLAIDFAHSRGVVHRDLKPGNVMLGDFGEVYVLDWGIARVAGVPDLRTDPTLCSSPPGAPLRGEPVTDDGARTAEGETLGTPGYMAPEQVRSDATLDGRADVYSLGCILFEMLALEPLHRRTSVTAILASTLQGIDARPSLRAPERDVPPELDAACARACSSRPDDRFATARELCDAIDRFLDGDRDLARRRELATVHAENAARASDRALAATTPSAADELDLRRDAMREAGRALALDPQQPSALDTMMRLMSHPPSATPPEAERAQARSIENAYGVAGKRGAIAYVAWLTVAPFLLVMGVREPVAAIAATISILVASCFSMVVARNPHLGDRLAYVPLLLGSVAVVVVGCIAGPLFILPTMAVGHVVGFAMRPGRGHRGIVIAVGLLSVGIPMALEWAGVIGPHYSFANDTITVLPALTHFPEIPTRIFLVMSGLGSVLVTVMLVGQVRDALAGAEKMLQVQAWQLRQLVPAAAQAIASDDRPTPAADFCLVATTLQAATGRARAS